MKQIRLLNGVVSYHDPYDMDSSKLKTVSETMPNSLETYMPKTQQQIKQEHPFLSKTSERNIKQLYVLEEERDQILINLIPQKKLINDSNIRFFTSTEFQFFQPTSVANELPEPAGLSDGTIFRVIGEGVKMKEAYTYYIVESGKVRQIPNYKSVEVLLFERGRVSEDIRVIELSQFEDVMRLSYQTQFIEQGLTPADAEIKAAEFMVNLANESKME